MKLNIVESVNKWCIDNNMRLNTTKCKVISYVPKSASPLEPILLNNNQLEVVNMYKYLGINLTPNMDNDQQWGESF